MASRMKKRRPARSLALASALALALAAPATAYAVDPVPPEVKDDELKTAASTGDTIETAVTGTVMATTVSVTVPTQVAFYIDPGATQGTSKDATANKYGQFTNPTNLAITNHSAVDVYGYVSKVTSNEVTLVAKTGDLAKPGGVAPSAGTKARIGVMVGMCDTTESMSLDAATDWMTESIADTSPSTRYYAFDKANHGRLSAAQNGTVSEHDGIKGSYTMTIRGAVFNGGWSQYEKFLVTPTFKIVTTDPSTVA